MGVALVTPFQTNGEVDYFALSRLVEFHLQNDTDYLVVLGTTAETPTLTASEQKEITRFVIEKVNKRIPIVLGVSGNNTKALIERVKTENMDEIDAILSAVPYYSKPTQEGIYQHYKTIAQATSMPVVLYNVPGRTGVNMTAETTLRLAHDFSNIIAVKEASGNMTQVGTIIKYKPENFQVISGDDANTFPLIALGAVGVISVIGNAFPKEFTQMVKLTLAGNYADALRLHYRFMELFELLFVDGSPAGIKSVLNILGYTENELRLPLVPARITTYEKIQSELEKLKVITHNS
jgi:4-hydroxy-tetrahydrodipicolinate synthase